MSACERRVYPPDVVKYVKAQLKRVPRSPDASVGALPESMELTERMKEDKGLRDGLVSCEIIFLLWNIGCRVDSQVAHTIKFSPITANQTGS